MKNFKKLLLWAVTAIVIGAICGFFGVMFSRSVGFVTELREKNTWLLFLLPLGGILSVIIYKLLRVKSIGAINVFNCAKSQSDLPSGLAPAVFCGTTISHLFGASVGREGAALQIGGGIAHVISKIFRFDDNTHRVSVMCGMAALFSAVFGTPLAACAFIIEVIMTNLCLSAVLPILASSIAAFIVAANLGISPEKFHIEELPNFSLPVVLKTLIITLVCIGVGYFFCKGLAVCKKLAKKHFKNEFLRIIVGGALTVALSITVGGYDYNGSGIEIIASVFETGAVRYEAFALKILFTIICVSAGYKGGEIIPTLFVGTTLGATSAALMGLPLGFGAAVGMAVLFCAATKCPVATILIACEMFGFNNWPIMTAVVLITFLTARYEGLYAKQRTVLSLIKERKTKKA